MTGAPTFEGRPKLAEMDDRTSGEKERAERRLDFWEWLCIVAFGIGMLTLCMAATQIPCDGLDGKSCAGPMSLGASLLLVAFASAMVGAVVGFLFGVPRLRAEPEAARVSRFAHNTNLEQVSDWLTKVIVGATLVELRSLGEGLGALSTEIANLLGSARLATIVGGTVISFCGLGFIWGYLWMSIRILRKLESEQVEP